MAICTKCGSVYHDEDIGKHVCKPENIPAKGKEKIPTTTEANIV